MNAVYEDIRLGSRLPLLQCVMVRRAEPPPPPRQTPHFELIAWRIMPMCRSIKPLANFEPPATDEEIRAAAL